MWLGTRVCSVQCTVSCDSGGLSSASKPAPPPSRVPPPAKFRDSVTAPPQKAHRGECLLLGEGARRVAWAPVPRRRRRRPLSVQHLLAPRPHSPRPLTGTSFRGSTDVHRRLPAAPQPPAPLPCPAPAEPSLLPGSASVGNFPGHLYSRPRVNCLVSSLPIHRRVTLPGNFTPGRGGRGLQEWRADWGAGLDQECGHLRKTVIR